MAPIFCFYQHKITELCSLTIYSQHGVGETGNVRKKTNPVHELTTKICHSLDKMVRNIHKVGFVFSLDVYLNDDSSKCVIKR